MVISYMRHEQGIAGGLAAEQSGVKIIRHRGEQSRAGVVCLAEFVVKEISRPDQAQDLRSELAQLLKDTGAQFLIMDCSNLEHLVTLGFGALLSAQKRLATQGGRVVLCGINPLLRDGLVRCSLDRILLLADDVPTALALVKGNNS